MSAHLLVGDVVEVLRGHADNSFDAVLCDPPYGLSFMGKRWDYDVPSVALWAEVLRVCKPGAPLVASFGTRTYHRGVCRIEDAGWEIRDCIAWMYGSGFPKNQDTQLKPAFEPYVLARKPLDGTVAENVARWGVGALAIDACRIGSEVLPAQTAGQATIGTFERGAMVTPERTGRWPANVILDEAAGASLDAQSGLRPVGYDRTSSRGKKGSRIFSFKGAASGEHQAYSDGGGASRFFYCAKASKRERGEGNVHPTVKPLALCEYLARLILPPNPGRILVPFAGSGSEMIGALRAGWPDVLGIERSDEYARIAEMRLEHHQRAA